MAFFSVHYTYTADRDRQDELRPEHRAYLATLVELGHLFASGPLLGTDPGEALLVFNTDNAETVNALLDQDPFHLGGQVASRKVTAWNPVIGALADQV
ncbi:YciI family protein [Propionibacteriaceae bacterium Y1923]|uniref:YciI family protein n=1 Tax=Aestuariimicrobium sp. Y1814 TaxID=3418742 RepID=UPI003C152539